MSHFSQRRAGILVPLFAIRSRSDMGVGDLGGLRQLMDWCHTHRFSVLQLLPTNETSDENSPYNSISSMALDPLSAEITQETVPGHEMGDTSHVISPDTMHQLKEGAVKYDLVKKFKRQLFRRAFDRFQSWGSEHPLHAEFHAFRDSEKKWLPDYALFRTLIDHYQHPNWEIWSQEHRDPASTHSWIGSLSSDEQQRWHNNVLFFEYIQWVLHRQWSAVRAYGESKGVYLMGDIPFGVSRYSADVWANRHLFDLAWYMGAPREPWFRGDKFTEQWGQNWGLPLYRWDVMQEDGFGWWKQRVQQVARYFQLFRIDHVIGFYRVYAFPWHPADNAQYIDVSEDVIREKLGRIPRFFPAGDDTPQDIAINQRQGEHLLALVQQWVGDCVVVGEDLGMVPTYIRPSLTKLGIAGFKIPVFERDEHTQEYRESDDFATLSLATLGTHDHETMAGLWNIWWSEHLHAEALRSEHKLDEATENKGRSAMLELYRAQRYLRLGDQTLIRKFEPTVREAWCRRLYQSGSALAVLMITDILGSTQRFNVPGSINDGNWSARLPMDMEDFATAPEYRNHFNFIKQLAEETGRS